MLRDTQDTQTHRHTHTHTDTPAGEVGAHGDQHVEDERGQVRLVHHRLPAGQQAPLQLRDGLQGAPTVHALRPAPRLRRQSPLGPELLHLRGRDEHQT